MGPLSAGFALKATWMRCLRQVVAHGESRIGHNVPEDPGMCSTRGKLCTRRSTVNE